MTSTDAPHSEAVLDTSVQKHLGLAMRVMYQKEVFIAPNDDLDHLHDRMVESEIDTARLRDDIRQELGEISNSETAFIIDCPAFSALAHLIQSNRHAAFQVLSNALWFFGRTHRHDDHRPDGLRTISDWGGWPSITGASSDEDPARFWFLLTMALEPKTEHDWHGFARNSAAFLFALMLRHGRSPDFWERLSQVAHGPFQRAVDRYRRSLAPAYVH